jgi:hypothetical protein
MFIGLSRQGPKGTMKHFVPPGTKGYNETFYPARDQKGIMKHFIPLGTKRL